MAMSNTTKARLQKAGWQFGTAADFLGMTAGQAVDGQISIIKSLQPRGDRAVLRQAQKCLRQQLREIAAICGIPVVPEKTYTRTCLACGKTIVIGLSHRRGNSRYCNAACRQVACRKRKGEP